MLAATAFAFTSSASAAEGKAMTPQQEKMANCAHENKGKKGDEYKQAMRDCLHGKSAAGAMKSEESKAKMEETKADSKATAQREKMKTCNAQAKEKNMKGKDRRDFMSECLKGG
ncbi:MAG TPA: PsiF family protein [Terracidiphilus sp.]